MRYKAKQLENGNWAVFDGNSKYWPHTETENKREAEQQALVKSMHWYEDKKLEAFDKLKEIAETDEHGERVKLVGWSGFATAGDLLC